MGRQCQDLPALVRSGVGLKSLKKPPDGAPFVIIATMTLTLQEVEHIALLARLELTQEEKERYQQQLSDILDHVAQLQALDTSQIQAASVVQPPMARLREDEALQGLTTEQALQNAPAADKDQFRVPPVLD